ncbi:ubiquitin-activating enzyme E1 [Nematocida displodere]|uniref:Ubiquitin-activating enzyme E1 n=1 Tax=Nematocida displodere TaxID=1805483 RepID=A0A177EBK6_9MICR|nr:ubiquitin-activating enzyme E1 [Nematocida displodere]
MKERKDGVLSPKVDEGLYSRQLYVIGSDAMKKMLRSNVLVVGLKQIGTEVAKNLCLTGIRNVSLFDGSKVALSDLGTAFYCTEADVGDRVDKSIEYKIKSLNHQVNVTILEALPETFAGYTAVVVCDATLKQQIEINQACRKDQVPFIVARSRGLFFQVFCDFGDSFVTTDENGEEVFMGAIRSVSSAGEVTLAEEERHGLENGDEIEIKGFMPRRYQVADAKAFKFSLVGYGGEDLAGSSFEQIKKHHALSFKSLSDSLTSPLITPTVEGAEVVHRCFEIVDQAEEKGASLGAFLEEFRQKLELSESAAFMAEEFFGQPWGTIAPIASVAGGIAAHEALKACSHKFSPLQQFMYYHALEALPPSIYKKKREGFVEKPGRYGPLYKIFGEDTEKIFKMGIFVIGAGAIGCEHLKNLALLGAGKDGALSVTDMDGIERSNLNRQFLFREEDISQMKSVVASREAAVLNPDMAQIIRSYTSKVGKETETLFNDQFYHGMDILMNALDNIDARLYMDTQAIYHGISMIDTGTLGAKGHTQVVIPHTTEHYGSATDPQEKSIPLCTIRNFPHLPVHCVEWALAEFKTLFTERISEIKLSVESAGKEEISDAIKWVIYTRPKTPKEALVEAVKMFYRKFIKGPNTLLTAFPADHRTDEGTPFWTPPKKMPTPAVLSLDNPSHLSYITTAQKLLSKTFDLEEVSFTRPQIEQCIGPAIAEAEAEVEGSVPAGGLDLSKVSVREEEFEKDSETNGHIEFITAAANIRCDNYQIHNLPPLEIKKIAGRIIPAIATTTAVVSGLAVIEAIKYVFWKNEPKKEDVFRNTYVSLALPLLTSSEPMPPQKHTVDLPSGKLTITNWNMIEVEDKPLKEIIEFLKLEWGVDIPTVMQDLTMLYCSFYSSARFKTNLDKTVGEILFPEGIPKGIGSVRLDAVVEDDEGNDLLVPFVKVVLRQ